jgi:hypothetical protein
LTSECFERVSCRLFLRLILNPVIQILEGKDKVGEAPHQSSKFGFPADSADSGSDGLSQQVIRGWTSNSDLVLDSMCSKIRFMMGLALYRDDWAWLHVIYTIFRRT